MMMWVALADDIHSNRGAEGEGRVEQESHWKVHRASVQGPPTHSLRLAHSTPQTPQVQWPPCHGQEILQAP